MFNFIFDGKLGDILAPVVPTNKLFLAIQHHKNDEVRKLILNNDLKNLENGYGAIHVACRYNNRYALELILSKDVKIETKDQKGNAPLHYASKYGHIDLCKYLIEKGSSTIIKNNNQETPYDVTDNHIVRQYLLPLQLSAERLSLGDSNILGMDPITMSALGYATSAPIYNNTQNTMNSYPMGGIAFKHPNDVNSLASSNQSTMPNIHDTNNLSHIPASNTPPSVVTPIQPNQGSHQIPRQTISSTRVIQPDGFHSSASDPVLQKRYGHVYETRNIAPPPTAMMYVNTSSSADTTTTTAAATTTTAGGGRGYTGSYSIYSAPPPGQQTTAAAGRGGIAPNPIYNRYVPYDVHNTNATTSMQLPPSHNPPMIHQAQKNTLPTSLYAANSNNSFSSFNNNNSIPNHIETISHSASTMPTSQNNKLLGNKSVAVVSGIDLLQSDIAISPAVVIGTTSNSNTCSNSNTGSGGIVTSVTTTMMNNHSSKTSFRSNSDALYNNNNTILINTNSNNLIYTNSITVATNFDSLHEHEVITANSSSSAIL